MLCDFVVFAAFGVWHVAPFSSLLRAAFLLFGLSLPFSRFARFLAYSWFSCHPRQAGGEERRERRGTAFGSPSRWPQGQLLGLPRVSKGYREKWKWGTATLRATSSTWGCPPLQPQNKRRASARRARRRAACGARGVRGAHGARGACSCFLVQRGSLSRSHLNRFHKHQAVTAHLTGLKFMWVFLCVRERNRTS